MATEITHAEDRTVVQISGALTIVEAQDTRDQLALARVTAARLDIDLSEVIEIDCTGLQLLLALSREDIPVAFSRISDPLRELLQHLNLLSKLEQEH